MPRRGIACIASTPSNQEFQNRGRKVKPRHIPSNNEYGDSGHSHVCSAIVMRNAACKVKHNLLSTSKNNYVNRTVLKCRLLSQEQIIVNGYHLMNKSSCTI